MEEKYLQPSLALVEDVFTKYKSPEEGKIVRELVEEIRRKKYYIPGLELIMVNELDEVIGYAMFSRFHIEGKYEDELLMLTPVAVKTELQRTHISKDLLEFGFIRAKNMGFKAVLVEGNPRNYNPRGFQSSYKFGIEAGPHIKLPHRDCLMVKELEKGALDKIKGLVDYSFYKMLQAGPEIWNAYDAHFNIVENTTLIRGEPIPEGLYHLVCDVLVKHIDGTYLLMKRDPRKHFGNMWEATAGGSALFGENPLACARRELREETGLVASELLEVGKVVSLNTIYMEYLCVTDWDKEKITLQEGETIAFKWVSKEELLAMKKDELVTDRMQNFISELK